ncbi:MAG: thioredoxin family protein [Muribaculaceae bacterium]|nr:thioredoxin family protein [Bacteroidales bacterium]MDE6041712.1 thioredoxin family protein [Muribaculaceae bacterium]
MNTYEDLIKSGRVVLVEFYATWCPHCQRMMPVIEQIRELVGDTAKIYQLDVDQNPELSDQQEVTGTPTFILYANGREVWRYSGELDGNILLQKIESAAA